MFGINVSLLTGRYYASEVNDPDQSEWPPHPARLFLALVATWADADEPDSAERKALEWLESQRAPSVLASEAWARSVDTRRVVAAKHFVPVNDTTIFAGKQYEGNKVEALATAPAKSAIGAALALIPEGDGGFGRVKQERTFPSVTPEVPTVSFVWDTDVPAELLAALDALASRLTRLGHSASLVSCEVKTETVAPNEAAISSWVPGSFTLADQKMRWVRQGQLAKLEKDYEWHQGEKPRKLTNLEVPYKKKVVSTPDDGVEQADSPNTTGDCYFFEIAARSRRLPITQMVHLASTFRAAVMSYADDPVPEGISGHLPNGKPSQSPHVAFAGMPFVGSRGDGRLMGLMMILPDAMAPVDKKAAERAIAIWEQSAGDSPLEIRLSSSLAVNAEREVGVSSLSALREATWVRPSQLWRSVTPIALPTHPGNLHRGSATAREKAWAKAEEGVRRSCAHVGLPEPEMVNLSSDPFWGGSRPVGEFPLFEQGGKSKTSNGAKASVRREQVHAEILFKKKVKGPLLLGAGRYLGLGLMRPVRLPAPIDLASSDGTES